MVLAVGVLHAVTPALMLTEHATQMLKSLHRASDHVAVAMHVLGRSKLPARVTTS